MKRFIFVTLFALCATSAFGASESVADRVAAINSLKDFGALAKRVKGMSPAAQEKWAKDQLEKISKDTDQLNKNNKELAELKKQMARAQTADARFEAANEQLEKVAKSGMAAVINALPKGGKVEPKKATKLALDFVNAYGDQLDAVSETGDTAEIGNRIATLATANRLIEQQRNLTAFNYFVLAPKGPMGGSASQNSLLEQVSKAYLHVPKLPNPPKTNGPNNSSSTKDGREGPSGMAEVFGGRGDRGGSNGGSDGGTDRASGNEGRLGSIDKATGVHTDLGPIKGGETIHPGN